MREALKIIAHGHVITCDQHDRGGKHSLLIRDGRIAEIAESPDVFQALHPFATVIDASDKLIVPGFVNAHFHSDSLLLRQRTEGRHFALWRRDIRLHDAAQKLLMSESVDDIRTLYLAAFYSHLKSGSTCVCEYPPAINDKGLIRMLQSIDRTDVRSVVVLQNWDQIRQARELGLSGPRCMIGLGREEDFTVYTFENLLRAAREFELPVCAHIAEQREDVEVVKKNFHKSVVAVLRDYRMLDEKTLLVHLNHASDEDLAAVEDIGASVAIAPRSTALKQTGYPAIRSLVSRNIPICLATDWASTDMLGEMRFLYELPLLLPGLRQYPAADVLKMATINAARALGLQHDIGTIEVGKKADLVFFSLADVRIPRPGTNASGKELSELLIAHLTSRDISNVMIGGEFYVGNGELMTIAEEDVRAGMQEMRSRYFPQAKSKPLHGEEERQAIKVIPFVPEPRKTSDVMEGFEEGFVVKGKSTQPVERRSPLPVPAPVPLKHPRDATLPELSKDVKKVFGDDDDF